MCGETLPTRPSPCHPCPHTRHHMSTECDMPSTEDQAANTKYHILSTNPKCQLISAKLTHKIYFENETFTNVLTQMSAWRLRVGAGSSQSPTDYLVPAYGLRCTHRNLLRRRGLCSCSFTRLYTITQLTVHMPCGAKCLLA